MDIRREPKLSRCPECGKETVRKERNRVKCYNCGWESKIEDRKGSMICPECGELTLRRVRLLEKISDYNTNFICDNCGYKFPGDKDKGSDWRYLLILVISLVLLFFVLWFLSSLY